MYDPYERWPPCQTGVLTVPPVLSADLILLVLASFRILLPACLPFSSLASLRRVPFWNCK